MQQNQCNINNSQLGTRILRISFSFALGNLLIFALLGLFALLNVKCSIPEWSAIPIATICLCVGCGFSAFASTAYLKKYGLLIGLLTGLFFFALYWGIAAMNFGYMFSTVGAIKLVSCAFAGCIGGVMGTLKNTKPAFTKK